MSPHWSHSFAMRKRGEGAPSPLLLDLPFHTPLVQPFPANQSEITALGLPPATALYTLEESSVPVYDQIGDVDLTWYITYGQPLFAQMAGGFWNGTNSYSKKCVEFPANILTHLYCTNNTLLEAGLQSFAAMVVYRLCYNFSVASPLPVVGKFRSGGLSSGWCIDDNGVTIRAHIYENTSSTQTITLSGITAGQSWNCILLALDRTANNVQLFTPLGSSAPDGIDVGDITGPGYFTIGGARGDKAANGCQIAWVSVWIGSDAEGMGQSDLDTFWQHVTDPTGKLTTKARASSVADLVGYKSGHGLVSSDFHNDDVVIGYDPDFSTSTKLGLLANSGQTNLLTESDDFVDASWAKTDVTVYGRQNQPWATYDIDDSPRGDRAACRFIATANNGYVEHTFTTVERTVYSIYVYIKRHSTMSADVSGRIIAYDAIGSAEIASQVFSAPEEWPERTELTFITPTGCTSVGFRIEIDVSGKELSVFRATAKPGRPGLDIYANGATATVAASDYRVTGAAGEYILGANGEIQIIAAAQIQDSVNSRHLLDARTNINAAHFERDSDQYLARATTSCVGINMIVDRSVLLWCKLNQNPPDGHYYQLCGFWSSIDSHKNWILDIRGTSGKPYLGATMWDGTGYSVQRWDLSAFTLTDWFHIAWAADLSELQATEQELWVNGVSQGNGSIIYAREMSATAAATEGYFYVGRHGSSQGYDGLIDCIRIYNALLDESTIQSRIYTQPDASESNLQAGYKFDNGVWIDVTGNNELTPYNSPTFVTDVPFDNDSRRFYLDSIERLNFDVYDADGALDHSIQSLIVNPDEGHEYRSSWNNASGSKIKIDEYQKEVSDTWDAGNDVETLFIGESATVEDQWEGHIASIKVYNAEQDTEKLLSLPFTTPTIQPFSQTKEELYALGCGSGLATSIWDFEEDSGNVIDHASSNDLTPEGGSYLFQGQKTTGLYAGSTLHEKKAGEFWNAVSTAKFVAASSSVLDIDDTTSIALLVVFRAALLELPDYRKGIVGKRSSTNGIGYEMNWSNSGYVTFTMRATWEQDLLIEHDHTDGAWHCALGVIDRSAGTISFYTDLGMQQDVAQSGTLSNDQLFSFGANKSNSAAMQIAYGAVWIGSAAEGMGYDDLKAFWRNAQDPTDWLKVFERPSALCDIVAEDAEWGTLLADYAPRNLVTGYEETFSHTSKLGLATRPAKTNLLSYSDNFEYATGAWDHYDIGYNQTVGLRDNSPRGCMECARFRCYTADNGYLESLYTTIAQSVYTQSILVRMHWSSVGSITGKLIAYDNIGAAEIATQPFTVDRKWQLVTLTFTTPVGCTQVGYRLQIDVEDTYLSAFRATAVAGSEWALIYACGGTATAAPTDLRAYLAAGDKCKGGVGELKVIAATQYQDSDSARHLIDAGSENTHAVDFDRASDQNLRRLWGDCIGINMAYDRTVESWVKLDQVPSSGEYYALVAAYQSSASAANYMVDIRNVSGTVYFYATIVNIPNIAQVYWDLSSFTLTNWNHFAWVLDISESQATENELFVNGVSQGNGVIAQAYDLSFTSPITNAYVRIAGCDIADRILDGRMDCVRIWDVARTEEEIQSNYQKRLTGKEPGLQGCWEFDGQTWTDKTDNNNTMEPRNNPTFVTDVPFSVNTHSVDLESTSSQYAYRSAASCTGIKMQYDRSVEFWAKLDQIPGSTVQYFVCGFVWGGSYPRCSWGVFFRGLGSGQAVLVASIYYNNSLAAVTWNVSSFTLTDWNHFAWGLDISEPQSSENTLWVNGIAQGAPNIWYANEFSQTQLPDDTGEFRIGSTGDGASYFDGRLDCVRVWDDLRTEAEIQANMYNQLTGFEPNLQGCWQFNGSVWADKTGNGNDLTPVNSPTFSTDVPFAAGNFHAANFERSSSQYARRAIGSCVGVNMTGDRSILQWLKFESLPGGGVFYCTIGIYGAATAAKNWLCAVTNVSGTLYFRSILHDGTGAATVQWDLSAFTLTDYNHFALVIDMSEPQATERELWVNGVSQGNGSIVIAREMAATQAASSTYFTIAYDDQGAAYHYDGKMDCVRVYDAALDEATIQARMYTQPSVLEEHLQAGYKFDGEVWTDVTGNNNLTPYNSPTFVTDLPFIPPYKDRRLLYVNSDEKLALEVYDAVGSLDHTTITANATNPEDEHDYCAPWENTIGSKAKIDGKETETSDTWSASDSVDVIHIGQDRDVSNQLDGHIALVQVYSKEQASVQLNSHTANFERSSSQYANRAIDDCVGVNMTGDRTFEDWIKFPQVPGTSDVQTIRAIWAASTYARNWQISVRNISGVNYYYVHLSDDTDFSAQRWDLSALTLTEWNHFSLVIDMLASQATQHELFINGMSQGNGTIVTAREMDATHAATGGGYVLGTYWGGGYYYNGRVDCSRTWSGKRTQEQIQTNMYRQLNGDESGLECCHQFDGEVWVDKTSNGNDLTPYNGPTFVTDTPF